MNCALATRSTHGPRIRGARPDPSHDAARSRAEVGSRSTGSQHAVSADGQPFSMHFVPDIANASPITVILEMEDRGGGE